MLEGVFTTLYSALRYAGCRCPIPTTYFQAQVPEHSAQYINISYIPLNLMTKPGYDHQVQLLVVS